MSKDIRSYFTKSPRAGAASNRNVQPASVKKRAIISSDEEDDVKIISMKKTEKSSKKTTKKQILSDDSEDGGVSALSKKSGSSKNKDKEKKKPEEKSEMKIVDISNMLGSTPVKRVRGSKKPSSEAAGDGYDDDIKEVVNDFWKYYDASEEADAICQKSEETKNGSGKRKKNTRSEDDTDADDITLKKPKLQQQVSSDHKERRSKNDEVEEVDQKAVASKKKNTSNVEINLEMKKKIDTKKKAAEQEAEFLEERAAKKKQSAALYQSYLSRGGARNPGSKPIPEGATNCLAGLSFVLTGVFDSLEREEASELIKKYGGRVTAGISKKIDYIVVGEEAGQSKIAKATSLKIKQISEDELLTLIRERPPGNSRDIIHSKGREKDKFSDNSRISGSDSPKKKKSVSPAKMEKRENSPMKSLSSSIPAVAAAPEPRQLKTMESGESFTENSQYFSDASALVEKYRPKQMKQIIGQHGDNSNAKKLHTWLLNWHKNRGSNVKNAKPSLYAKNDNGAYFKACLLSGPPGVGKTTTVQVVCNELGFDLLEFNASDTRSKKLLKDEISGLLSNKTVKGYFSGNAEAKPSIKHVLLMDEVDGMAGNEDRGGLQELIALIKTTDIPIVCICNDRNHPKMRTLANYVFDLRFQKPRSEQIRGAMKTLCCKENINISNDDLDRLIEATNQDIRQVINHLAILIGDNHGVKKNPGEKSSSKLNKDLKLGPWEVVKKVFTAEEHKKMTIHDKSDLFFHDYNIAGLFVQENYLSVIPKAPNSELLDRVAATADSLSLGDQVEKAIRSQTAWSLLPMQACYSSVIPGSLMSGHIASQINFPSWLGRNSRRGKFDRLLQEITAHTRLVTGASKEAVNMDYLKPLRDAVVTPLGVDGTDGIERSMQIMNHYHLLREDLDSLVEISLWPGDRDPMQSVESKVKAAFTRTYNKNSAPVPFVVKTTVSKKRGQASQDDGFVDDDEEGIDGSDVEDDDLDVDKMIKAKKSTSSATASTSKGQVKPPSKRGGSRGRGRGRGK